MRSTTLASRILLPMIITSSALFAQTTPTGTALSSNGLLVGATAEVGSSDKEGLFDWTNATKVQTVMNRDFGLVQTTSYPAWGVWNGSSLNSVTFDMTNTNRVINWADAQGKKVSVHLLAGSGNYFPTWLQQGTGSWNAADLDTLLNHWISAAMQSNNNASKVDYWNVVNEAFMWDGSYWKNLASDANANKCPWQDMGWETDNSGLTGTAKVYTQHPKYIRRAFEIARKFTNAKLELRDYGIEFWDGSKKSRAFYQLVKHLLNSGVPIDAVGFQGHFRTDHTYDWSKLKLAVQQYRNLGLEVYFTELDYGDADPIAAATSAHRTASFDSLQAQNLYEFAKAATSGGVNWLCMWGVADNTNTYWRMGQSALLFDESYNAKNSYYKFRQGIVDGLAPPTYIMKSGTSTSTSSVKVMGGVLHFEGYQEGVVTLLNLLGAPQATLAVHDGNAQLPPLAQGAYLWKIVGHPSAQGLIQMQ